MEKRLFDIFGRNLKFLDLHFRFPPKISSYSFSISTMSKSASNVVPDKIGSLLFCPACGSLLDVPGDEDIIKCEPCGMTQDASSEYLTVEPKSMITTDLPDPLGCSIRQCNNYYQITSISISISTSTSTSTSSICFGCRSARRSYY